MREPKKPPELSTGNELQPDSAFTPGALSKYEYQPFGNDNSIRILTLDPGRPDDSLRGTLEAVDIDKTGSYEAISYVWGPPGSNYEIRLRDCNGEHILKLIGESIFAALHRLRLPDRPRRVWADQICINQQDLKERGQQVQFMGRIYKNTSRVLVWLGLDEKDEARAAFSLVHKLNEIFKNDAGEGGLSIQAKKDLEQQVKDSRKALHDLTDRVWFRRGWIVQEIGTKAPAVLHWGDESIDWNVLYDVCERLTHHHHLRADLDLKTSDIKFLFQRFVEPDQKSYHANRFNFIYELHRARQLNFTDDKDRVFAFLGHYSLQKFPPLIEHYNEELASLEANYETTVEDVYTKVAKRALKGGQGDSALIALAAVQHLDGSLLPRHETGGKRLPSWVADWRTFQGFILSEPINPYRAHGDWKPDLAIKQCIMADELEVHGSSTEKKNKIDMLEIQGLELDTIEMCSRVLKHKELHSKKSREHPITTVEYLWHEICQKECFNLRDKYRNGQEAFFAFMQTLSNGCAQIAGRLGKPYNEIPASRWLEHAAMYLKMILQDTDMISPELLSLANEAQGQEEWSRSANGASKNRIFARTNRGYYVLGPAVMEKGDIITVLSGGKMPFCLRQVGERYLLVGECYIHGLMEGEAIEMKARKEISEKKFEIM